MAGTTFENVSYDLFRGYAAEYFRATQNKKECLPEQAENGNKALGLAYIGGVGWTEAEIASGVMILELAMKREMEVAFAHAA